MALLLFPCNRYTSPKLCFAGKFFLSINNICLKLKLRSVEIFYYRIGTTKLEVSFNIGGIFPYGFLEKLDSFFIISFFFFLLFPSLTKVSLSSSHPSTSFRKILIKKHASYILSYLPNFFPL